MAQGLGAPGLAHSCLISAPLALRTLTIYFNVSYPVFLLMPLNLILLTWTVLNSRGELVSSTNNPTED